MDQLIIKIVALLFLVATVGAKSKESEKVVDIFQQILLLKKPKSPASQQMDSAKSHHGEEVHESPQKHLSEGIPKLLGRLRKTKLKAEETRIAIRQRWDIPSEYEQDIDAGVGFTAGLGDVSMTTSSKGLKSDNGPARQVMIGKMMRAVLHLNPTFTVAFAGTSVSAGHDNWFNQSYAHCYQRAFQPALKSAGVKLSVRNHAMGGNSITPSHYCAPAQLDNDGDTDLVVYEFAMIASRDDCRMEYFIRSILQLPRAPAFMAYTTSGVSWRDVKEEEEDQDAPPAKGKWETKLLTKQTCNRKWLIDYYAQNGAHYGDLGKMMHKFGHLKRFTSKKMMGNKAIHGGDVPSQDSIRLGVEDDVEELEMSSHQLNEKKIRNRRRRLAPFHPGPGAHEWQGQMLAHAHLKLMIEAIEKIEKEAEEVLISHGWNTANVYEEQLESLYNKLFQNNNNNNNGVNSNNWHYQQTELPKPIGCHKEYCETRSTQCFTSYTPHSPQANIELLVIGPPLFKTYDPSSSSETSSSSSETGRSSDDARWTMTMPPAMSYKEHASYGYLDFKFAIRGDKSTGELEFEVKTTLKNSPIIACQPQCPWGKCKANQRLLNDKDSVLWKLDGKKVEPPNVLSMPKHDAPFDKPGTCLVVAYAKQTGRHVLSIQALDGNVFLSHLLFY